MHTSQSHAPLPVIQSLGALHYASASVNALGGVGRRLDQFVCGLAGHDELMRFEPKRLSLRCTRCGHQTRGWDMTCPRPRRLLPGVTSAATRLPPARPFSHNVAIGGLDVIQHRLAV
jgi:hypothetical protein